MLRRMDNQKGFDVFKGLNERRGGGLVAGQGERQRGDRWGRAGLRYLGGRYRVVCYLSTSDQIHLLQG